MPGPTCDVCTTGETECVACSSLGAISLAYCRECGAAGREPLWVWRGYLIGIPRDQLSQEMAVALETDLSFHKKDLEEFWGEVEQLTQDYERAMDGSAS